MECLRLTVLILQCIAQETLIDENITLKHPQYANLACMAQSCGINAHLGACQYVRFCQVKFVDFSRSRLRKCNGHAPAMGVCVCSDPTHAIGVRLSAHA